MSERPTITVYIPSFNQRELLAETIDSVLAQTRLPDQILIIDDASSDGSQDLIRQYADRYPGLVDPILKEKNSGISAVRSLAIEHTKCDLVTYVDGDDTFAPRKLELEEQALLDNPEAGFAYTNFIFTDEHANPLHKWDTTNNLPSGDLSTRVLLRKFPKGCLYRSELVRTEIVRAAGSYRPDQSIYEDYDIKIRISARAHGVAINEPLHSYRLHSAGLSSLRFATHADALEKLFEHNASIVESHNAQTKRAVKRYLSNAAWRVVRECAKREHPLTRDSLKGYAKRAIQHRPLSICVPRNLSRLGRAWFRAER